MDTFAIRLAVVRAVMGWNYDQAARATGLGAETWRTWEKGTRRCTDIVGAATRISEGTEGVVSREWIILGGPLAAEATPALDLPRVAEKRSAQTHPRRRKAATLRESHAATGTEGAAGFRCTSRPRRQLRGRRVTRPHRRHASPRPERCPQNWGQTSERRFVRNGTTPSSVRPIRRLVDAA